MTKGESRISFLHINAAKLSEHELISDRKTVDMRYEVDESTSYVAFEENRRLVRCAKVDKDHQGHYQ